MSTTPLKTVGYTLILVLLVSSAMTRAAEPTPTSGPAGATAGAVMSVPTDAEIRQAVRMLNHPAQSKRREAIKQLCGWGPIAFTELRRAADGGNLESALSARQVLKEMENAILIGARVKLSVDRNVVEWDEPFALTVRMANPTGAMIRAPWPARKLTTRPAPDDADQVAAMLDVADFLIIEAADDHEVEFRVDPVGDDPLIAAAVRRRIGDDPPTHEVKAGESSTLTVPEFNRGWARFLFMRKGTYTMRLAYQPEWNDKSWTNEGFGRVVSEPIELKVTSDAPAVLRESQVAVALRLLVENDDLVARLVCTWDRPVWINLNRSARLDRDAVVNWQLLADAENPVTIVPGDDGALPPFSSKRIHRLDVGATLDVERWPIRHIREIAMENLPKDGKDIVIAASYTNILDVERLRKLVQDAGESMPRVKTIFTGRATAEAVTLPPDLEPG